MTNHGHWTQDPEQVRLLEERLTSAGMPRRTFLKVLAAAGGAIAAAGAVNTIATEASADPGAAPTAAAAPRRRDNVFRTYATADPDSHDFNKDLYCGGEIALFAGLTVFDYTYTPQPYVADSWEANSDGSVWTWKLNKNAKWTNGDPVTAGDFVYSIIRQLEPATAAPYSSFFYDVKGAEAFNKADPKKMSEADRGKLREAIGVKALDDKTLQMTLEGPRGYMAILMAYLAALPAHRASVEKYGDKWTEAANVVSNGPFKMTAWERNRSWTLERFEDFFAAKPKVQRVEVPIVPYAAGTAPYENDEIDFRLVEAPDWPRVQTDAKLSKEYIKFSLSGTWYLVPEVKHPPFDNLQVRKAMAHAIDRDEICEAVLKGLGIPAYTFNPPDTPGFVDLNQYPEFKEKTKFDPQLAMDMLKGTPFEGGKNWPAIKMTMREEGAGPKQVAEAIQAMLKENLGMTVDLEIIERRAFRDKMWNHENQLTYVRWYQDYPDPHNEFYVVFYSKGTTTRQEWGNDQYNDLVQQAASELTWDRRAALYRQAETIMLDEAAVVNVYYPLGVYLVKPYVKGIPVNSAGLAVPDWNIYVDMKRQISIDQ